MMCRSDEQDISTTQSLLAQGAKMVAAEAGTVGKSGLDQIRTFSGWSASLSSWDLGTGVVPKLVPF